jgi:hypothetical protein
MSSTQMTWNELRAKGCAALVRELGPTGYVRFIQQFRAGHGDYTQERRQWQDGMSLEEVLSAIAQRRKSVERPSK